MTQMGYWQFSFTLGQDMKWLVVIFAVLSALGPTVCGEVQDAPADVNFSEVGPPSFPSNQAVGPPDDIDWNETVDFLLHLTNNRTSHKGRDEVTVPDIYEQFTRKVGPLTLMGEFSAHDGRLKGLSGVRRTGDVTVLRRGTSMTMTCLVGLETARFDYEHYRIKIRHGPSVSGSIEGHARTNSVRVTATMDVTDTACTTTLDEVKVVELSGLKVKVHRLGPPLDSLLSRITTWLTRVFREDLHVILERALTNELTRGLERSRCEKYASHFIFVEPK